MAWRSKRWAVGKVSVKMTALCGPPPPPPPSRNTEPLSDTGRNWRAKGSTKTGTWIPGDECKTRGKVVGGGEEEGRPLNGVRGRLTVIHPERHQWPSLTHLQQWGLLLLLLRVIIKFRRDLFSWEIISAVQEQWLALLQQVTAGCLFFCFFPDRIDLLRHRLI